MEPGGGAAHIGAATLDGAVKAAMLIMAVRASPERTVMNFELLYDIVSANKYVDFQHREALQSFVGMGISRNPAPVILRYMILTSSTPLIFFFCSMIDWSSLKEWTERVILQVTIESVVSVLKLSIERLSSLVMHCTRSMNRW